ncbi:MAG: hypothetical protein ACREJ2_08215 [Planctomycetota bacterium]
MPPPPLPAALDAILRVYREQPDADAGLRTERILAPGASTGLLVDANYLNSTFCPAVCPYSGRRDGLHLMRFRFNFRHLYGGGSSIVFHLPCAVGSRFLNWLAVGLIQLAVVGGAMILAPALVGVILLLIGDLTGWAAFTTYKVIAGLTAIVGGFAGAAVLATWVFNQLRRRFTYIGWDPLHGAVRFSFPRARFAAFLAYATGYQAYLDAGAPASAPRATEEAWTETIAPDWDRGRGENKDSNPN